MGRFSDHNCAKDGHVYESEASMNDVWNGRAHSLTCVHRGA